MSSRFYVLRPYGDELFGTTFAFGEIVPPINGGDNREKGVCPECGEGLGNLVWLPPHRIKLSSQRYPDLLWGAGFSLMVSSRFRRLYEVAGLKGVIRFDPPAEIVRVGRKSVTDLPSPVPEYHYFIFQHGGADLDDELSGAYREHTNCSYCRPGIDSVERIILKRGSWMGADIFVAFGLPGHILVTERLRDLIEENHLTGGLLIPAEEYRLDRSTR